MVAFSFNGQGVEARYGSEGGGLPPGKHKVVIEKSEMCPTKDHAITKNEFLKFTLRCIDGLSNGGIQEDRLNVHNNSQEAVRIANSQLAAYCLVTIGRVQFNQTEELHNIPFYIEVRTQRNNPDFTEVSKLLDLQGNEAGKGQQPQVQSHPQGPSQFAPQPQQQFQPQPQQGWQPSAIQQPEPQPQAQPQPQQQWQPQGGGQAPPWGSQGGNQNAPGWGQR